MTKTETPQDQAVSKAIRSLGALESALSEGAWNRAKMMEPGVITDVLAAEEALGDEDPLVETLWGRYLEVTEDMTIIF